MKLRVIPDNYKFKAKTQNWFSITGLQNLNQNNMISSIIAYFFGNINTLCQTLRQLGTYLANADCAMLIKMDKHKLHQSKCSF